MILPLSYHDLNLIIFLSQADPHASSIWRVDVHGGEHVARDAVHRPPGLDAHAHQVEFEEYDADAQLPTMGNYSYLSLSHSPQQAPA